MKLHHLWSKLAKHESKIEAELKQSINEEALCLKYLEQILDYKIEQIRKNRTSHFRYSEPQWAEYQAHHNGCEETLLNMKKLLDFSD